MFKKLLASVGIGSAKVDTYVLTDNLTPGAECDLKIVIKASENVEQDINGLSLALCTSAKSEKKLGDEEITMNETVVISRMGLSPSDFGMTGSVLKPGELFEHDLTVVIDEETPVTAIAGSKSKVWIATGLDIDFGLDSSDKDYLSIYPDKFQKTAIEILGELGYSIFKVDVEKGTASGNGFRSGIGCYQEFEFKGGGSFFSTKEIELTFVRNGDSVGLLLEKDRFLGGDSYHSTILPFSASRADIKAVLQAWL